MKVFNDNNYQCLSQNFQVGCGLSNMHNLRDALLTQTKHVQFVVFERANQVKSSGSEILSSTSVFNNQ